MISKKGVFGGTVFCNISSTIVRMILGGFDRIEQFQGRSEGSLTVLYTTVV
jgi:hypothetical protein